MIKENMQWYINQLALGFQRDYRERPKQSGFQLEDLKRQANAILRRKRSESSKQRDRPEPGNPPAMGGNVEW